MLGLGLAACDDPSSRPPPAIAGAAAPITEPKATPPKARDRSVDTADAELPKDCGALIIEREKLLGRGAGEKHPRLVATERAIAGVCTEASRAASLSAACTRLHVEYYDASVRYGPNHPALQALTRARKACPPVNDVLEARKASPPPDCVALRAERDALVAAGKGERHPQMVAAVARLSVCP